METTVISLISLIIFISFLYLLKVGKMKIFEFTASMFALIGGILMVLMGKSPAGYVGTGLFFVGVLLRLIDVINKPMSKR